MFESQCHHDYYKYIKYDILDKSKYMTHDSYNMVMTHCSK